MERFPTMTRNYILRNEYGQIVSTLVDDLMDAARDMGVPARIFREDGTGITWLFDGTDFRVA